MYAAKVDKIYTEGFIYKKSGWMCLGVIIIEANAKINLTLDILGKRTDGYHEVAMVMQSVGLHDTIRLEKIRQGIELTVDQPGLAVDATNLAWRAARCLMDVHSIHEGVRIHIAKRIPIAAGLAGGSADAAGVLRGMNRLFGLGLSTEVLCELGAQIGSDVPFCIRGGTMFASGRGELLERLPDLPPVWVVLAKPPVSVSTAWAYQSYDAAPAREHPDNPAMLAAIAAGRLEDVGRHLGNVLEAVTVQKYGEIARIRQWMLESGALAAMMSGSGPTVFSLSADEETARRIARNVSSHADAAVFVAQTVGRAD